MITHAERFRWEQSVLAHPKLTAAQKNVLARPALHHNVKSGRCDPGVETVAKGAGVSTCAAQKALAAGEALGLIRRRLGGGRSITTSYELRLPSAETLNGGAPFSETANGETLFGIETLNGGTRNPERRDEKPCTAVHPNIEENKKENIEEKTLLDFEEAAPPLSER